MAYGKTKYPAPKMGPARVAKAPVVPMPNAGSGHAGMGNGLAARSTRPAQGGMQMDSGAMPAFDQPHPTGHTRSGR